MAFGVGMTIVTVITLLACLLYLTFPIYNWVASLRMLGREAIPASRLALRLDRNRPRYLARGARPDAVSFAIRFVVAGLAVAVLAFAFDQMIVLNLSAVLFALGIGHLVLASTPPVVLYLSSSGSESERMQIQLHQAVQPYRLVTFLRSAESMTQSLTPMGNLFTPHLAERGAALESDLRQSPWKSWQEAVANVMRVVRVIVIDGRRPTDFLNEENSLIRELRLEYKTLRIAAANSGNNAVNQTSVTEERLLTLIRELLRSSEDPQDYLNPLSCQGFEMTGGRSISDLLSGLDSDNQATSQQSERALAELGEDAVDAILKSAHEVNRRLLTGYQMDLVLEALRRRIKVLGLTKSGRAVQMVSAAVADSSEMIYRQRKMMAKTKSAVTDPRPIWLARERLSLAKRVQQTAMKALVQIGDEAERQLTKHIDAFSPIAQRAIRRALRSIQLRRFFKRMVGKR